MWFIFCSHHHLTSHGFKQQLISNTVYNQERYSRYKKRSIRWMCRYRPYDTQRLGVQSLAPLNSSRHRIDKIVLIKLAFTTLGLLFSLRLTDLQVDKYRKLKCIAQSRQMTRLEVGLARKSILDCYGNILAIDLPAYDLYVHPRMFTISHSHMAEILSTILEIPINYLESRFHEGESGICLIHQINTIQANQIRRLQFNGLELVRNSQRIYPQRGSLASILGYVDTEGNGQAGIESSLNSILKYGRDKFPSWIDGHGNLLGSGLARNILFPDESVLQLTVDAVLQEKVNQLILNAMNRFRAKRIAAIIMEAHTGAIRCLSTSPSYDPNSYPWFPMERFRCWPTTDIFEPGSTFKPINMAIALENRILHPTDRILDTGNIRVGDSWIRNAGGGLLWENNSDHLTPTQILQRSSNVGMVRIMQALDPARYHRNLIGLGLGQNDSHTEFSGMNLSNQEVVNIFHKYDLTSDHTLSVIKDKYEFIHYEIEAAAAAFGQGLAMTPMKLLQLIAAIANGGISVTPHLISDIQPITKLNTVQCVNKFSIQKWPVKVPYLFSDTLKTCQNVKQHKNYLYFGHIPIPSFKLGWCDIETIPPHARERRRLFSPQTCRILLGMLEQVVLDPQATGSRCFIPGYSIAGKTGTAQKPSPSGGYLADSFVTSFVGIYPAYEPRFVTLVIIDEPEEPFRFAFNTAVDITQAIISQLIIEQGDQPSYPTVSLVERRF